MIKADVEPSCGIELPMGRSVELGRKREETVSGYGTGKWQMIKDVENKCAVIVGGLAGSVAGKSLISI